MLTLQELCHYLDELFSAKTIVDYCPNGLQVEGKHSIEKIATAVSANLATIETAIELGVDALIVHHGIFWKGDSMTIEGVKRKKIELLLKHHISLIAYHLPLDMHAQLGNNWKAAQDLGWKELLPFPSGNPKAIGVKGKITACSVTEFKEQLENYYGHSAVYAPGEKKKIETVALISGGAYKSIGEAAKEGIDAFITGNFDEPAWHQAAEENVHFFALGHSATERVGPLALARYLEHVFYVPCQFIDTPNPF